MPSNSPQPTAGALGLRVQGDAARQVVEFIVWDKGIGIAQENLPRLFQPFVQLDSGLAHEYSGTGLGLALVYRMAALHEGSIDVASQPGAGSTFTLTLPWRQPKVRAAQVRRAAAAPAFASAGAAQHIRAAPTARCCSWRKTMQSAPNCCPKIWKCTAITLKWQ